MKTITRSMLRSRVLKRFPCVLRTLRSSTAKTPHYTDAPSTQAIAAAMAQFSRPRGTSAGPLLS
eukprot:8570260-Lingulodinium_polyedra.AAC.1